MIDKLFQFLPILIIIIGGFLFWEFKKRKAVGLVPESVSDISNQDKTFEEKMLLLQGESNKRLKGIDNTLDWFFWIMIIGSVIYGFFALMTLMPR
jgi:hypothetical protein